jgi:hypothetical protein
VVVKISAIIKVAAIITLGALSFGSHNNFFRLILVYGKLQYVKNQNKKRLKILFVPLF